MTICHLSLIVPLYSVIMTFMACRELQSSLLSHPNDIKSEWLPLIYIPVGVMLKG